MRTRTLAALSSVLLIPGGLYAQRTPVGFPSVPVPTSTVQTAPAPSTLPPAVTTPVAQPMAATPTTPAIPMAPTAVPAPAAPAAPEEAPAEEENKPDEKFLLEKLLATTPFGQRLSDNGWRLYGWTQGSYTAGTAANTNLPVPFIDRSRTFSLNQNWIHLEKAVDTSKKEFQLGLTADGIIPGTDARFTYARGMFDGQNASGRIHGFDLYQAYVDVFLPNVGPEGTTFRAGKFATFLEYEVVQGISNPFISRSYLFQYNPFTHTGGLAITPLNDNWTVQNGIVLGNDNFFDTTARATYIGQVKWAPKEGKTSIALGTTITNPRFDAGEAFNYYNVYNLQVTHKLSDKMNYVLDASFSHMDNIPDVGSTNWYGLVNYLTYDHTDKIQSKGRFELFEDSSGIRTGTAGLYTALTYGITWKPADSLYIMPEVRYDNNSRGNPFDGRSNMFTSTIGFIYRW